MSDKATPRPWGMETVPTQIGHCHKIGPFPSRGARDRTYACVYADGIPAGGPIHEELEANARLIVVAVNAYEAHQRAAEALRAIIYASDQCMGHRACNHDMTPWQEARAALAELDKVQR